MEYCKRCLYPANAKPTIILDDDGVCSGCRYHESRQNIDWQERQEMLKEITESEEGFRRVSIGQNELLFSHGNSIVTALVAKAPYRILLDKVDDFTEKFELLFS